MTKRKIVQIAAAVDNDWGTSLYALTEDGSLWELNYKHPDHWSRIPDLPEMGEAIATNLEAQP